MSISGTVKDRVTNKGIAGIDVMVMQENALFDQSAKYYFATTDDQGNFIIRFVPPGEYELFTSSPADYVENYVFQEITVPRGKNIVGLEILLDRAGSVSGKILQKDGVTPLKGATIVAYTPEENVVFGATNEFGEYLISGLRETNSSTLVVLPDGYAGIFKENISVFQGQTTLNVNFVLDFSPMDLATGVIGTVKAPNGLGVANAMVVFYGEKGGGKATTDALGNFSIMGLSPGIYTGKVISQDYELSQQSNIQISTGTVITVNFSLRYRLLNLYPQQTNIRLASFSTFSSANYTKLVVLASGGSGQSCTAMSVACKFSFNRACFQVIASIPDPRAKAFGYFLCLVTSHTYCTIHIDNLKKCGACK